MSIEQDSTNPNNQDIPSISEQNTAPYPVQSDAALIQPDIYSPADPVQGEIYPQPTLYADGRLMITTPSHITHASPEFTTPVPGSSVQTRSPLTLLLTGIGALVIILGGISLYGITTYQNTQKGYATATAQRADKNATGTVLGNLATATGAAYATSIANIRATVAAYTQQAATEQALANARATVLPPLKQSPYSPYTGNLTVYDFLNVDDHELPDQGACTFKDDGYHATVMSGYYQPCPERGSYGDFAMDVQLTIDQGDCGGLIFRGDITTRNYYFYEICVDGTYIVYRYHGKGLYDLLKSGSNGAIQTGTGATNVIAVVAIGHNLDFYVNNQAVDHETDDVYIRGGSIALVASGLNQGTEVTFAKERLWTF